jgi:cold shock CspA family protein
MKSVRKKGTKKKRGRPATGQGVQIGTRWPEQTVAAIDAWASSNETTRTEALRRLVEGGSDVFVHISALERAGLTNLAEGAKVSYEPKVDPKRGKSSAENLRLG